MPAPACRQCFALPADFAVGEFVSDVAHSAVAVKGFASCSATLDRSGFVCFGVIIADNASHCRLARRNIMQNQLLIACTMLKIWCEKVKKIPILRTKLRAMIAVTEKFISDTKKLYLTIR